MPNPFNLDDRLEPVIEVLDHQTDDQLHRNFVQTLYSVYEVTEAQAYEIRRIGFGSGSIFTGDFVEGRTVTINGEVVLSLKMSGCNAYLRMPCTDS